MGQKTDARIFRQGVNKKNWEFKYIEKSNEESSLFLYKTLEIQRYLNQFFKLYKIKIHNCKILYSENLLQIFLSFYVTTTTFYTINKNLTKYSKECKKKFKPLFSNKHKKRKKLYRNKSNFSNVKKIKKNKKLNIPNIWKKLQILNDYINLTNPPKYSNTYKIKKTLYNKSILLLKNNINLDSTTNLITFQKQLQFILTHRKSKKKNPESSYRKKNKKHLKKKKYFNIFKPYSTSKLKKFQKFLQAILSNRPKRFIRNFNVILNTPNIIKKFEIYNNYCDLSNFHKLHYNYKLDSTTNLITFKKLLQFVLIHKKSTPNVLKKFYILNNYINLKNYHKCSNTRKIENILYNKTILLLYNNFKLDSTTNLITLQKLLQSILIYKELKKKHCKYPYFKKKIKKKTLFLNKFNLYLTSTIKLKESQEILQIVLNNRPKLHIRNFNIKKNQKILIKKNILLNKFKPYSTSDLKQFQEILLKSLSAYTKNKINISLTLQNLNRYKNFTHTQIKGLKQIFKQLRNFVKKSFFKEAINILLITISKRKSAKILADFISEQFRRNQLKMDQVTISRKDNFFLGFLKQTLILLIKSEISCVMGLKIVVKGRFNRAPRARTRTIHFGKFSLQSFNSKIDYYQSTAYTVNGTFGIKVWLCENNN